MTDAELQAFRELADKYCLISEDDKRVPLEFFLAGIELERSRHSQLIEDCLVTDPLSIR